jgi:hypothetical protein
MIQKISLIAIALSMTIISAEAGKSVIIDLTTQTATAYENDIPVFSGRISSGTAKRPTPTGRFRVLEKDIDHVSSSWPKPNGGAKMHYMQRLTNYGIAMHLGFVPNYPASHGCIRLENGLAQKMYSWGRVGMSVRVMGHAPARVYRPVAKRTVTTAKIVTKTKVSPRKRKVSALDMVSTSPKVAERIRNAEKAKEKLTPKVKASRRDPLKAMRT